MKYTVNLDENGFLLSIAHTMNDDTELDLSQIDLSFLNAYQFIDGVLTLNTEKKAEIEAESKNKADKEEIYKLEQKLNSTDYIFAQEVEEISSLSNPVTFISDLIKILVSYSTKYKDIISNRKAWRDRIKELEG